MPKNGGSPGADIIDHLIAVHITNSTSFGVIDEKRVSVHIAESADRRVHSPGDMELGTGEKGIGKAAVWHGK
jgi:hypothetical protein